MPLFRVGQLVRTLHTHLDASRPRTTDRGESLVVVGWSAVGAGGYRVSASSGGEILEVAVNLELYHGATPRLDRDSFLRWARQPFYLLLPESAAHGNGSGGPKVSPGMAARLRYLPEEALKSWAWPLPAAAQDEKTTRNEPRGFLASDLGRYFTHWSAGGKGEGEGRFVPVPELGHLYPED